MSNGIERDHLRLVYSADSPQLDWDKLMTDETEKSLPIDVINNSLKIAFSMSKFEGNRRRITKRFQILDDDNFNEAEITWHDQEFESGPRAILAQISFILRSEDVHPRERYMLKDSHKGLILETLDINTQNKAYARRCTLEEVTTVAKLIEKTGILNSLD
jgi:hypothetical protein